MKVSHTKYSVLCPNCEASFHYMELSFVGGMNDYGWIQVECGSCSFLFAVAVKNPTEVSSNKSYLIKEIIDKEISSPSAPIIDNKIRHDFPENKLNFKFKKNSTPLYLCSVCEQSLDAIANDILLGETDALQRSWSNVENYLLASSGAAKSSDSILVSLDFECDCSTIHTAIFVAKTYIGASNIPLVERCNLIHVTYADLESRLNSLATKSEVMELLEKLLIRWHAIFDKVILAVPFIGHQWLKEDELQDIWNWLFENLDPDKAVLLTRSNTWTSFKNLQKENGLSFELLQKFGIEEKVVSAGLKKQDFHAKFFAGISKDMVEILSGSANLVRGPSIENITFSRMSFSDFDKKYLQVMKLKDAPKPGRNTVNLVIRKEVGGWKSSNYKEILWFV